MELVPLTLLCWHCALVHGWIDVISAPLAIARGVGTAAKYAVDKSHLFKREEKYDNGYIKWDDIDPEDLKVKVQSEVKKFCPQYEWPMGNTNREIDIDTSPPVDNIKYLVISKYKLRDGSAKTCYVYSGPDYRFTKFKMINKTGGTVTVTRAFPTLIVFTLVPFAPWWLKADIMIMGKHVQRDPSKKEIALDGYCVKHKK